MKELTAEEQAIVAREVTGLNVKIEPRIGVFVYGFLSKVGNWWTPATSTRQWKVLVEWLADEIEKIPAGHRRFSAIDSLLIALNKRDTTALMSMVLELKGAG